MIKAATIGILSSMKKPIPPDELWNEIRVDMRQSGTSGASNYNTLAGNPHISLLTISDLLDITGATTGISINSVATANWGNFSGLTSNNAVPGITGGTFLDGANAALYQSIHYNYGTTQPARYDVTRPQYRISGLIPNKTYRILITGSQGTFTFLCSTMEFRVQGSSLTSQTLNGGHPTSITNITVGLTFDVESDSSGEFTIWMNSATSQELAVICGLIIKQI